MINLKNSKETQKTLDAFISISGYISFRVILMKYAALLLLAAALAPALFLPAGASSTENVSILSWYPQVVDYVYVNDTVNETITYSITTAEPMSLNNWTVDGVSVENVNTAFYQHTWDNKSVGFHTVIYKGNNSAQVEFRWYVNVYEIGEYPGGSIFDIIDDALENHVTDIKIRMFKYKIAKHEGKAAYVAEKVNRLHDEIAKRQMTREALRHEFQAGNISAGEYVAALKQAQKDAKYNMKLAEEMAKVTREVLKDEKTSSDLERLSEIESSWSRGHIGKGKKDVEVGAKDREKEKASNDNRDKNKGNRDKGRG